MPQYSQDSALRNPPCRLNSAAAKGTNGEIVLRNSSDADFRLIACRTYAGLQC
jgi:hypothetical protein